MPSVLEKGNQQLQINYDYLKLPQEVQDALLNKVITERHARSLIPLKDPEKANQIIRGNY